jgi:hypothetical protein
MFKRSFHKLIKALLLAVSIFVMPVLVAQAANQGQLFGALDTGNTATGSDAYLTTPDPPTGYGQRTSALTAVTNYWNPPFIEAGATKYCTFGCSYHPYWSSSDIYGNYDGAIDYLDNLAPGGWYRYKTFFIGNNTWESQWCSGSGCKKLADVNLHTNAGMRYALSGGESDDVSIPISTNTSNNQRLIGSWGYYCYNAVLQNGGGTITPCGSNYTWSVHRP